MWVRVRIALVAMWIAAVVLVRRLVRGRLHPTWSYRMELVASIMRNEVQRAKRVPLSAVRKAMLNAPTPFLLRRLLRRTEMTLAGVRAEVTEPISFDEARDPTVFYLHGGGYVLCSPGTHRDFIARQCVATGARFVAIDYRLAPEDPYPAGLDDALAAYRALLPNVNPERLYLGGDSAGGGLCLATMLRLRDEGETLPRAAFLYSPWVDMTVSGETMTENDATDFVVADVLRTFSAYYYGETSPREPGVSPVFADLTGLPSLFVHTGRAELLLSENETLVRRAREAGVEVSHLVEDGFFHVVPAFAGIIPEGNRAIVAVGQWLNAMSAPQGSAAFEGALPEEAGAAIPAE